MAKCGILRIDGLFEGSLVVLPIAAGDQDDQSVGAVQDLLRAQGFKMPSPLASDYGTFGPKTTAAVTSFRQAQGLDDGADVDPSVLQALVKAAAPDPIASRPYTTLGLDLQWSGLSKVMTLTTLLEGGGKFGAINPNTDKAGLSFGIIQWAQKPGRLLDILQAFHDEDAALFAQTFGAGDVSVSDGLLAHVAKAHGGVDPSTGETIDSEFDLIDDTWTPRFLSAARNRRFQTTQIAVAKEAFQSALTTITSFAQDITTERNVAFMLDLANQHGVAGARDIYESTVADQQTLAAHLAAIVEESVARVADAFKDATRARRELFLSTDLLSDDPFFS
jgi:peptidoglycan hydrolase-like protein with peptidoglycan-binding domain